jgi:hypothetical protein
MMDIFDQRRNVYDSSSSEASRRASTVKVRYCAFAIQLSLCSLLSAFPALASSVSVSAQADIFVSGTPSAPSGALLPTSVAFASGSGQVLSFPSVTGLTSYGYPTATIGPDGGPASGAGTTGSDFASQGNGLSGIINDPGNVFFLVGVFLASSSPVTPPPTLDFTGNTSFTSLSPLDGQLFFIGDGLTGTGSGQLQQFLVPADATRLFLGFADGAFFRGAETYGDNSGSLSVIYQIQSAATATPEPSAVWLFLLASAVLSIVVATKERFLGKE